MTFGPNHKPDCKGEFTYSGEGYNRVRVCRCGAEDHEPDLKGLNMLDLVLGKRPERQEEQP